MNRPRAVAVAILFAALLTPLLYAADFSRYRGFEFGSSLAVAAEHAGVRLSEVRLVHTRPALIQELDWRPGGPYQSAADKADPVQEGLLRFYDGKLFQIVATYNRRNVEGMTEEDMVEAVSRTYGTATRPAVKIAYHSNYGDVAPVIARWEDSEYSCSLVRTGDRTSYALILSLKRLDALATTAIVEARRLDALEAPQRAIELQNEAAAERRLALDEARAINLPSFRP